MFWDPWEEMNRMFRFRTPAIDMFEKNNEVIVIADLPGVNKEEIEISINDSLLTIKAETKEKRKEEKEGYYYAERRARSFQRTISLPCEVIPEKASSAFKNGVLEIHLPKRYPEKKEKGFKIKIQ